MAEDWADINISLDLVEAACRHLHFLDNVDNCEKILSDRVLRHALRRYEQLWLPLAANNEFTPIVPPIDIAWMWYCHTLSPKEYRHDCRKLLKKTLHHHFVADDIVIRCTNNAIELWYDTYPTEGFNIIRSGNMLVGERNNKPFKSSLSVDLVEIAKSQIHFCYQVALPHFRDYKYLDSALARYKQFLMLKSINPDEFLTPSVDVLLMWYTHMAHPIEYAMDTKQLLGKVLPNNVKIKADRISERFVLAREATRDLWKKISSEEMVRPGTVLRGKERSREIGELNSEDLKQACIMIYKVHFSHIELTDLPRKIKSFNLKVLLTGHNRTEEELKVLIGKKRKRIWTFSLVFDFKMGVHTGIRFQVDKPNSLWCLQGEEVYATGRFNLGDVVEQIQPTDRALSFGAKIKTVEGDTAEVVVDGAIDIPVPYLCMLTLRVNSFRRLELPPRELTIIWGPSALPHTPPDVKHVCYVAEHVLTNHNNEGVFQVRVVHVPSLLMTGARIHVRGKLVATTHVIGSAHLPSPAQVAGTDACITFEPEAGERAMLIRNNNGDWGLCIGKWVSDGTSDYLEIRFMSLMPFHKVKRCELKTVDLEFHSFNVNLQTGEIVINPSRSTVAENLALIFSIGILHVLCSPTSKGRQIISRRLTFIRNEDNEEVEVEVPREEEGEEREGKQEDTDQRKVEVRTIYATEESCSVLMASGVEVETPCNDYIIKRHGSLLCDMFVEAHDIVVEEWTARRKDVGDEEDISVKRKKKKKRSSKLREGEVSLEKTTESQMSITVDPAVIEESVADIRNKAEKRKKKKKRKNRDSNLSERDLQFDLAAESGLPPVEVKDQL